MIDTPPQGTFFRIGRGSRSLIAILEGGAVAFCHYANPESRTSKPQWMPLDVLEKTVRLAAARKLRLVCLLGLHPLPAKHASMLRQTTCSFIQPLKAKTYQPKKDTIFVLEAGDVPGLKRARGRGIAQRHSASGAEGPAAVGVPLRRRGR